MSNDRILSQILGSGAASGFAGGLAGGLLTSKAGRKIGKKALRVGGVAAVGGLAYAAWSRYQASQTPAGDAAPQASAAPPPRASDAPPAVERFVPPPARAAEAEALGLTILRAMIAAAQADGKLDGAERSQIFERLSTLDLSPGEQAALFEQLGHPVDLNALVAAATTPERAAEIYAASLLAIDVDTAAERGYLAMLAARLELPEALVASIHGEVEREATLAPMPPAAAGVAS